MSDPGDSTAGPSGSPGVDSGLDRRTLLSGTAALALLGTLSARIAAAAEGEMAPRAPAVAGKPTVLITGANRGIGLTIAEHFAAEGVALALLGRNEAGLTDAAAQVRAKHPAAKVCTVVMDLEQPQTINPAVEASVTQLGGVDILVNCAGGAYRGRLEEIPDEMWERYFKVKPLGLLRMTRAALPHLKKSDQGRVINISGTRGREPDAAGAGPGRSGGWTHHPARH